MSLIGFMFCLPINASGVSCDSCLECRTDRLRSPPPLSQFSPGIIEGKHAETLSESRCPQGWSRWDPPSQSSNHSGQKYFSRLRAVRHAQAVGTPCKYSEDVTIFVPDVLVQVCGPAGLGALSCHAPPGNLNQNHQTGSASGLIEPR